MTIGEIKQLPKEIYYDTVEQMSLDHGIPGDWGMGLFRSLRDDATEEEFIELLDNLSETWQNSEWVKNIKKQRPRIIMNKKRK